MININIKSTLFAFTLLLLYIPLSAQIKVGTNKDKSLFAVGESMSFRVTGGSGTAQYSLYYNSRDDKSIFQTGTITLNGGTTDIPYTATQPGAVYCKVQSNSGTDAGTALFDPLNITPFEKEPSDFDTFWQNQKLQLSRVPIDAQLSPIATQSDGSQSFSISMATVDSRRVYGYITIPAGSGPFPAIITLPPFGTSPVQLEELTNYGLSTQGKAISLTISVQNAPINSSDPNAYQPDILTDPAKFYNRLMVLATVRCVDYLNSRSDFNGDIGVSGISQGGGLALSLAGLSSQVKALALSVPAGSEHTARRYHRASGFPYYDEQAYNLQTNGQGIDTNAIINAAKYHDAAYFAKRYKGPIQADLGYKDEVTFIASQYDAINAHQGSSVIFNKRNDGHDTPWIEYWQGRFAFFKKYLRGFNNPVTGIPSFLISAGNDQQVSSNNVTLTGSITLNDNPELTSTVKWEKISGPGNVSFSQQNNRTTAANFSTAGAYVLRFSAVNDYLIGTEGKYVIMVNYVTVTAGSATPTCKNDTTRLALSTCNAAVAGTTTVTLKNIGGCDSLVFTTTTYQPAPVPTITRSGNTLTSSSGTNYQWYKDGVVISGATGNVYTVTISGNYTVQVGNIFGCTAGSAVTTVTIAPTYDCPTLQKNIGDACDDGNPNTTSDRIRAGCICQGDAVVVTNAIAFNCPKDITIYTLPGSTSSVVQWSNASATTTCTVGTVAQNCVTTDISGFKSLGKFGNSQYFLSTDKKNWETASQICKSKGGYLAVLTSKDENDFVSSKLTNRNEAYFFGFSGKSDSIFRWVTGESVNSFSNWEGGFPVYRNGNEYYACMLGWSNGKWANVNPMVEFPYIMEIDCGSSSSTVGAVNIAQTAGPLNNSVANVGTYKITYEGTDNCGNKNTCNFNLTVAQAIGTGSGDVSILEAQHINGKTSVEWMSNIKTTDGVIYFQRSYTNVSFQTVKTQIYSNSSRALNAYAFEDVTDKDGTVVYYRVVLQMGDGTIKISDIKNVRPTINRDVVIYPNPTSGEFNLQLKAFEKLPVELIISNTLGQEIYREKIAEVQSPIKTISPATLDLKQGFYILTIISKNQAHTYPLVVE